MANPKAATIPATLSEPEQSAWFALLFSHAAVMSHIDKVLSERHGITFSTCEILCRVDGSEPIPVRSVARDLVSVSPSRASRLIQELIDQGHLRRTAMQSDGRISLIGMTAAGRRYTKSVQNTFTDAARECFFDALDERDLAALCHVWHKVEARCLDLQE
jgi:DNA-binding MarR family transcriptional regulator